MKKIFLLAIATALTLGSFAADKGKQKKNNKKETKTEQCCNCCSKTCSQK